MPSTKRLDVSVLLDIERYDQLKAYAARKKLTDMNEAVSLIVSTGLSRQGASDKYQAKQSEARKAAGGRTRKKAEAKPKSDAKIAAKKRVAKAEGASTQKAQPVKKVAKSNATVGRIVPQRPGPAAAPSNGGIPPTTTNEVAEA